MAETPTQSYEKYNTSTQQKNLSSMLEWMLKSGSDLTKEEITKITETYEKDKKSIKSFTKAELVDSIKDIQKMLWVEADGVIWPKTIKALEKFNKSNNGIINVKWLPNQEVKAEEVKVVVKETPKEEIKEVKKVEEVKVVKETPKEVTLNDIKKSISDIKSILKDWIQTWEEEDLTNIIKELQDKKVLKAIPGIKNWKLEKGKDLLSIWEDIIKRLEKVEKKLEKDSDNKKEQEEKAKKEKAKKEQEELDSRNSKEKAEKEKFSSDLSSLDLKNIVNSINTLIDSKNNLSKPDNLEDEVDYEWQKAELKSKLDKIKLNSDNKTFSDLTSNSKVEKDDKWNITLKFNIDPKGFDKFDSSKVYEVKLSSMNLTSQKDVINQAVEKAYTEQVSDLTK